MWMTADKRQSRLFAVNELYLLTDKVLKLAERVAVLEAADYRLRSLVSVNTTVPAGTTTILEYIEVADSYQLSISDNAVLLLIG
jgi:hypothetical protein